MIDHQIYNDMFQHDKNRQTGRTNRMLLEATRTFLCRYNVLVTAHSMAYASDLCSKVKSILWAMGITDFTHDKHTIRAFGSVMIFKNHNYNTCKEEFDYVYMDHYRGRVR